MCFSLQASTIAAASLLTIGGIGVTQHWRKKTILIVATPFIFGIQQLSEAVIWAQRVLNLSPDIIQAATYTFLFFAYFFWPIWIPTALWYAEPHNQQKKILSLTVLAGIVDGCVLLYYLITTPAHAAIQCAHIIYWIGVPQAWYLPGMALYATATIAPWFISSIPRMWLAGLILAISYLISWWFYFAAFASVWCFFAAILSALILVLLDRN